MLLYLVLGTIAPLLLLVAGVFHAAFLVFNMSTKNVVAACGWQADSPTAHDHRVRAENLLHDLSAPFIMQVPPFKAVLMNTMPNFYVLFGNETETSVNMYKKRHGREHKRKREEVVEEEVEVDRDKIPSKSSPTLRETG